MSNSTEQLTTFYIGKDLYGIDVMKVQEVTGKAAIVRVPLAPAFVLGLVNLRGQIATALGLREMFGLQVQANESGKNEQMSVVCRMDGNLVSLLVDSIGDVVEVNTRQFEKTPDTVPHGIRKFLKGVCKMEGSLLSILDLEKLSKELSHSADANDGDQLNPTRRIA